MRAVLVQPHWNHLFFMDQELADWLLKKISKTRDLWSKTGGQCDMEERTMGRNQGIWWQIFINNLCGFREIILHPVLHFYPTMATAITYLTIWGDGWMQFISFTSSLGSCCPQGDQVLCVFSLQHSIFHRSSSKWGNIIFLSKCCGEPLIMNPWMSRLKLHSLQSKLICIESCGKRFGESTGLADVSSSFSPFPHINIEWCLWETTIHWLIFFFGEKKE